MLNRILFGILCGVVILLANQNIHAQNDGLIFDIPDKISMSYHDNKMSLEFSDDRKTVSGEIILKTQTLQISDAKLIDRNDRFYIIDRDNKMITVSKKIGDDKYIFQTKIKLPDEQLKIRFISESTQETSPAKNTTQRNLFDAMKEKQLEEEKKTLESMTHREKQLLEKQNALDAALKAHEERMKKIQEDEKKAIEEGKLKTHDGILEAFKAYQNQNGTGLLTDPDAKNEKTAEKTKTTTTDEQKQIETFVRAINDRPQWKDELRYVSLVTDDAKHRYNPDYKEYVGNELENAKVTIIIKDPENKTLEKITATTDRHGEYVGSFIIPDKMSTRGEYTITANAVMTFKNDKKSNATNSDIFFVQPLSKSSTNHPPTSVAGLNQTMTDGKLVTHDEISQIVNNTITENDIILVENVTNFQLDGSGSSDPDNDELKYLWKIISTPYDEGLLEHETTPFANFTSFHNGTTTLELTVTDRKGLFDTDLVHVIIENLIKVHDTGD